MKQTMIAIAIGAAALMGGTAANAASTDAAKSTTAKQATDASQSTDFSAGRRHHHWHGYRHHYPRYGYYRAYRPHYYDSYGYYGRPRYYGGGPGISFSFGSGGYRGWYERQKARSDAGLLFWDNLTGPLRAARSRGRCRHAQPYP